MTDKNRWGKQLPNSGNPLESKRTIPEDIQPCWYRVARRAQAACHANGGYAVMTMTIVVNRDEACFWLSPQLDKVEPSDMAKVEMAPETAMALQILATKNGSR